jgi:hypothetical protein
LRHQESRTGEANNNDKTLSSHVSDLYLVTACRAEDVLS